MTSKKEKPMKDNKEATKSDRVLELLKTGPAKSTEIGEVLEGYPHALSGTLSAMARRGLIVSDGGRPAEYRLPTAEEGAAMSMLLSKTEKKEKKKKTNGVHKPSASTKEKVELGTPDSEMMLRSVLAITEILGKLAPENRKKVVKLVLAMDTALEESAS